MSAAHKETAVGPLTLFVPVRQCTDNLFYQTEDFLGLEGQISLHFLISKFWKIKTQKDAPQLFPNTASPSHSNTFLHWFKNNSMYLCLQFGLLTCFTFVFLPCWWPKNWGLFQYETNYSASTAVNNYQSQTLSHKWKTTIKKLCLRSWSPHGSGDKQVFFSNEHCFLSLQSLSCYGPKSG